MNVTTTNSNISFSETQQFLKNWKWLLAVVLIATLLKLNWERSMNFDSTFPIYALVVTFFIFGLVFLLIALMNLKTRIDENGIYYKYVPLHREEILVRWSEIREAYIRKYKPIQEYGGWGIRLGIFGQGRAYNVSGNMGLQIVTKKRKKLLLGTQKPQEITDVLNKLTEAGIIIGKHNSGDRF